MAEDGKVTPTILWKTSLFSVPWKYFLASCFCPCIVYEQLIKDIPESSQPPEFVDCLETKYMLAGSCCLAITCCMPVCPLGPVICGYVLGSARTRVRTAKGIAPSLVFRNSNSDKGECHDTCTAFCCCPFALAQQYHEYHEPGKKSDDNDDDDDEK